MPDRRQPARRRRWVLPAVGVLAVIVLIASGIGMVRYLSSPVDLRGSHVTYEGSPPSVEKSSAVPQVGSQRFIVPSVGLDVPLGALSSVQNVIEPPGFTSAYWVRDHGVSPQDPARGTVFVVMHSLRDGAVGPGNFLIDVSRRTARVPTGARIQVDDVSYSVTKTLAIDKPAIAEADGVWADTPNRLVVITCLPRPDGGPSSQNIIIEATRVG